jgi:hypothetical protein
VLTKRKKNEKVQLMSIHRGQERRLFMVLSPRSVPYARLAVASLYKNCAETFSLVLITDTAEDKNFLNDEVNALSDACDPSGRPFTIYAADELADAEAMNFGQFPNIRSFRHGHPCWRKITDPILLSHNHEEMIILDPDLYFPNRFCFEATPANGILLMWQQPSCLLPPEVVTAAMVANISLAHHTDIGVAQWRMPIDLTWLDWLIGKIGSTSLPRSMHVESIVWAALAMKLGGGHLNPGAWVCYHRTQLKRVLLKLGMSGTSILEMEKFVGVKCFHAGGEAKWWLEDAHNAGVLAGDQNLIEPTKITKYRALQPQQYQTLQRNRRWLKTLGYYRLFES